MQIQLYKKLIKVQMVSSWILGFLASLYIIFYPKTGDIPLSEAWTNMLFYFGNGLLLQYILLHFFNEQENSKR